VVVLGVGIVVDEGHEEDIVEGVIVVVVGVEGVVEGEGVVVCRYLREMVEYL